MKFPLPFLIVTFTASFGWTLPPTPEIRTWTSTDRRKIEASFLGVDAAGAKIRLANRTIFTVPLDRLSTNDQAFVEAQTKQDKQSTSAGSDYQDDEGNAAHIIAYPQKLENARGEAEAGKNTSPSAQ